MYLRAKRYAFVAVDQVVFALLPYVCGLCATRKTLQCPSVSTRCRRRALRKHFEARSPAQALNLDALPPHPSPHEGSRIEACGGVRSARPCIWARERASVRGGGARGTSRTADARRRGMAGSWRAESALTVAAGSGNRR